MNRVTDPSPTWVSSVLFPRASTTNHVHTLVCVNPPPAPERADVART